MAPSPPLPLLTLNGSGRPQPLKRNVPAVIALAINEPHLNGQNLVLAQRPAIELSESGNEELSPADLNEPGAAKGPIDLFCKLIFRT